jgi:hypothetical protein
MQDISAFGLQIQLIATSTFPVGFNITEFADDTDPFDVPSLQVADKAMGINGDLIVWSKANPILISISLVPGSLEDILMALLLEANRVGKGKISNADTITMVGEYPNGTIITLLQGRITDGPPGSAVSSAGRLKSKTYQFAFENKLFAGA